MQSKWPRVHQIGDWLTSTVRVTLASSEVMRVRVWGPGHRQSSAASLRRLGRAGSEDSRSGPGGEDWMDP